MEFLKMIFPWSFGKTTIKAMAISVLIYIAINVVGALVCGLLSLIPLVGGLFTLVSGIIGTYSLVGVVLTCLSFLGVLKE